MKIRAQLQRIAHSLIEYRILLSFGLSAVCGIALSSLYPINIMNPMLRLIALKQPPIFRTLVWSYDLFLYSTPFLILSTFFSLTYIHIYRRESDEEAGALPSYPDPRSRQDLSLVVGELHRQLVPKPSPAPQWLTIPERGLYTGTCIVGATGSGKTVALVLPAMRQLFAYCANDPERKLSGVVLEVKGDLCRQLRRILKWCGREQDYVEVSLDGDIRYKPAEQLARSLRAGVQYRLHHHEYLGQGEEPFWQQSYTDLVRYVILLHRVRDGYLTLVDLFRTVISAGRLEEMLIEVGSRFSRTRYIGIGRHDYRKHEPFLSPLGFEWNKDARQYLGVWTEELERLLVQETNTEFFIYTRKPYSLEHYDRFDSVRYWYWEHWKFFRSEVKTSIIQGHRGLSLLVRDRSTSTTRLLPTERTV